jgi:protein ImuB
VRYVPWGDDRTPTGDPAQPWPGRLPAPAPAAVPPQPLPAVVYDSRGALVGVTARLEVTTTPEWIAVDRAAPAGITSWAGPWPFDEHWWAPGEAQRGARFQFCLADGRAVLAVLRAGHWAVEALYD